MSLNTSAWLLLVLVVSAATAQENRALGSSALASKRTSNSTKAVLQCSAADVGSAGAKSLVAHSSIRRDSSCYVDVVRAVELAKDPAALAVDIRGRDDYARLHLPEAINLPMSDIKTKTYLANRTLLIYGAGRADPLLEELCADLKQRGFSRIKMLSGGLLAWAKIAGGGSDIRELAELTAAQLFAESLSSDSLIVNVSTGFRNSDIEPRQVRLDRPLTAESLANLVRKGQIKAGLRRIVLVGVNGMDPADLHRVLSSSKIDWPVFYYAGDSASYEASVQGLHTLWAKKDKGPAPQKCGIS